MKRKITLLLLAASSMFTANAQVFITEDFNAPFTLSVNGWTIQNNSAPTSTLSWFQGNNAVFPAFNGGPTDYVGCNFNSTTGSGDISNWLISPTVALYNGAVIEFATRTADTGTSLPFPDRLQLRVSQTNTNAIPAGVNNVGTFTDLLLDINPNLSTNTSSVVNSGSVNGYPQAWAIYTVPITGVTGTVTGRFAFRYFVTNSGPVGANGSYIGIDAVRYSNPCVQPTVNITSSAPGVCAGNTVSLVSAVVGTVPVNSYTWSNGQTTSSTVVTPTATTTYSLFAEGPGGCVSTVTAVVTVTANPTVQVSSYTVCAGTSATLTATGATSYTWDTGATTNTIVDSPAATTVYTVTGFSAGGACHSDATATITVGSQISVNVSASSNTICSGETVTLTATSSATSYSWNTGATTPVTTVTPAVTTVYSVGVLAGTLPNICVGANTIEITVIPSPTITYSLNPASVCQGSSYSLTASGGDNYIWFNSPTTGFTVNPLVLVAGTPGPRSYTLVGIASNGCGVGTLVSFSVNAKPTVNASSSSPTVCTNATVALTGTGADTYEWSGGATASGSSVTYSNSTAGSQSFTLIGTTTEGCKDTANVSVNVIACNTNTTDPTGIGTVGIRAETSIFPNPFTNELKINVLEGSVVIYNALGQVVITSQVKSSETIDTAALPKGAYMVKAYNSYGELVKTVKLIKN